MSAKETLITFIIPVYNTSVKNFSRCISSVNKQGLSNFEIIVIDDGSKEINAAEYDHVCSEYNNVELFHIPNSGAANARNLGIRKSTGKYICFVDSDDYLPQNGALTRAVALLERTDVDILFGCNNIEGKNKENYEYTIQDLQLIVIEQKIINGSIQIGSPWAKLFRREFLIKNRVEFNKTLRRSHDRMFILEALEARPTFCFFNEVLYYFCNDELESLSRGWNPKTKGYLYNYLLACESFIDKNHPQIKSYEIAMSKLEMLLLRQCVHQVIFHPSNKCGVRKRYRDFSETVNLFLRHDVSTINYVSKGMYVFSFLIKKKVNFVAYLCLELDRYKRITQMK